MHDASYSPWLAGLLSAALAFVAHVVPCIAAEPFREMFASEAELPLKLNRREPGRVGRDQIPRRKPEMKRQPRAMQDRTCRHRHLMPARPALEEVARVQLVRLGVSTSRTPVAVRPAACDQIPPAVLLRREPALELGQRPRKVGSGHGPPSHPRQHNM